MKHSTSSAMSSNEEEDLFLVENPHPRRSMATHFIKDESFYMRDSKFKEHFKLPCIINKVIRPYPVSRYPSVSPLESFAYFVSNNVGI